MGMAGNLPEVMRDVNIFMVTVSILIAGLRFYVRQFMMRVLGADDIFALIAWALLMAQASMEIYSVKLGIGKHMPDVQPEDFAVIGKASIPALFPTQQLLFFLTTGFLRLSVASFLPRLNKEREFIIRVVYPLQAFIVTVTIVCFMMMLFECKRVPDLWDRYKPSAQCAGSQEEAHLFWAHAIIGVATDLMLLVIPLYLVYTRMLASAKSIRVLAVFGIGIFVIVAGIIRLAIIVPQHYSSDVTYEVVGVALWTDIEEHVGFWVACFPSLQPLVRILLTKVGLSTESASNTYGGAYGGGKPNGRSHALRLKAGGAQVASRANVLYHEDSESSKGIFELDEEARTGMRSPTITADAKTYGKNGSKGDLQGGITKLVEVKITR